MANGGARVASTSTSLGGGANETRRLIANRVHTDCCHRHSFRSCSFSFTLRVSFAFDSSFASHSFLKGKGSD